MSNVSRRSLLGGLSALAVMASASSSEAARWWLHGIPATPYQATLNAAAIVTPMQAADSPMQYPTVNYPLESAALRGDGKYDQMPVIGCDVYDRKRVKNGQPLLLTIGATHGDPYRGWIDQCDGYLCGRDGVVHGTVYTQAPSTRTAAIGFQFLLTFPNVPNDTWFDFYGIVSPHRGVQRRIGPIRIMVEGSARPAALDVYCSEAAGSNSNAGTAASPVQHLAYAISLAANKQKANSTWGPGTVWVDPTVPAGAVAAALFDYEATVAGAPTSGNDIIEIRPYNNVGRVSCGRTGQAVVDTLQLINGNVSPKLYGGKNYTSIAYNHFAFFNFDFNLANLWYLQATYDVRGAYYCFEGCTISDPDSAAGQDMVTRNGRQNYNDSFVINAAANSGYPFQFVTIGCSGHIQQPAGMTHAIGNNFHTGWDINFFYPGQNNSATFMSHNVIQDRSIQQQNHSTKTLNIASISHDAYNERTTVIYAPETISAVCSISVTNGVATLVFYSATAPSVPLAQDFIAQSFLLQYGAGQPSAVTQPMIDAMSPVGGGISAVDRIAFNATGTDGTTCPLGTLGLLEIVNYVPTAAYPGATVTVNCPSITGTIPTTAAVYTFSLDTNGFVTQTSLDDAKVLVWSGAAARPAVGNDAGTANGDARKSSADYPCNHWVYGTTLDPISASGAAFVPIPVKPMWQAPGGTVASNGNGTCTLTAGVNTTSGGALSLTSQTDANGNKYMTVGGGAFPASIVWGAAITYNGRRFKVARAVNNTGVISTPTTFDGSTGTVQPYSFYVNGWDGGADLQGATGWSVSFDGHGASPGDILVLGGTAYGITAVSLDKLTITFKALPSGWAVGQAVVVNTTSTTIASISGTAVTFASPIQGALAIGLTSGLVAPGVSLGLPLTYLTAPGVVVGGQIAAVQSVAQNQVVLSPDLGAVSAVTGFNLFTGAARRLVFTEQYYSYFGALVGPLPLAVGDGLRMIIAGEHIDAFQFPSNWVSLDRLSNVLVQCSKWIGNDLQGTQANTGTKFTIGTLTTTAGSTAVSFNLPSLPVNSNGGAASTVYLDGAAYKSYTVGINFSASGGVAFRWQAPRRHIRVLFLTGVLAGKDFRIYSVATTGSMVILDDKNNLNGAAWTGAVGDTVQHPLPLSNGDVIYVGGTNNSNNTTSPKQARMFTNNFAAIGTGTVHKPFDGGYNGWTSTATDLWSIPYNIEGVGWLSSIEHVGLPGQQYEVYAGGGLDTIYVPKNWSWVQSNWNANPLVALPLLPKNVVPLRMSIVDSLHGGVVSGSGASTIAQQVGPDTDDALFTNSVLQAFTGGSNTEAATGTSIQSPSLPFAPAKVDQYLATSDTNPELQTGGATLTFGTAGAPGPQFPWDVDRVPIPMLARLKVGAKPA